MKQYICPCCRYSTNSLSSMKTHFKTIKHKQNKIKQPNLLLNNEEKNKIVNENHTRQLCAGMNKI